MALLQTLFTKSLMQEMFSIWLREVKGNGLIQLSGHLMAWEKAMRILVKKHFYLILNDNDSNKNNN